MNLFGIKLSIIVFAAVSLTGGCASTDRAWQDALRKNTVEAYEDYVARNSKSEHVAQATARMDSLKQQQKEREALEAQKKAIMAQGNEKRLQKLRQYAIGNTTESEFSNDGWSAEPLYYGFEGVLSAYWDSVTATYTLGHLDLDRDYPKAAKRIQGDFEIAASYRGKASVTFLPTYTYYQADRKGEWSGQNTGRTHDAEGLARNAYASHIEENGMIIDVNMVRVSSPSNKTISAVVRSSYYVGLAKNTKIETEVCKVVFENGILKNIDRIKSGQ